MMMMELVNDVFDLQTEQQATADAFAEVDRFAITCRLAGSPTRRSPLSVKAITEGVVRAPSAFSMTRGVCIAQKP